MSWQKNVFKNFKLYAITDLQSEDAGIVKKIEAAYCGGADIIQLRSNSLSDHALYELGLKIRKLADRHRKLFFINDRPDLAILVKADGVHLGQNDLPVREVKKLSRCAGVNLLIGKSTHSLDQATAGKKEGADYIGVGPVFQTPTKPDYQSVGLSLIRQVRENISIPFAAIGGIDSNNIDQVLQAGAQRIAVVRAVFGSGDPCEAVKKLREKIETYCKS